MMQMPGGREEANVDKHDLAMKSFWELKLVKECERWRK
jgi:hypothetical protein